MSQDLCSIYPPVRGFAPFLRRWQWMTQQHPSRPDFQASAVRACISALCASSMTSTPQNVQQSSAVPTLNSSSGIRWAVCGSVARAKHFCDYSIRASDLDVMCTEAALQSIAVLCGNACRTVMEQILGVADRRNDSAQVKRPTISIQLQRKVPSGAHESIPIHPDSIPVKTRETASASTDPQVAPDVSLGASTSASRSASSLESQRVCNGRMSPPSDVTCGCFSCQVIDAYRISVYVNGAFVGSPVDITTTRRLYSWQCVPMGGLPVLDVESLAYMYANCVVRGRWSEKAACAMESAERVESGWNVPAFMEQRMTEHHYRARPFTYWLNLLRSSIDTLCKGEPISRDLVLQKACPTIVVHAAQYVSQCMEQLSRHSAQSLSLQTKSHIRLVPREFLSHSLQRTPAPLVSEHRSSLDARRPTSSTHFSQNVHQMRAGPMSATVSAAVSATKSAATSVQTVTCTTAAPRVIADVCATPMRQSVTKSSRRAKRCKHKDLTNRWGASVDAAAVVASTTSTSSASHTPTHRRNGLVGTRNGQKTVVQTPASSRSLHQPINGKRSHLLAAAQFRKFGEQMRSDIQKIIKACRGASDAAAKQTQECSKPSTDCAILPKPTVCDACCQTLDERGDVDVVKKFVTTSTQTSVPNDVVSVELGSDATPGSSDMQTQTDFNEQLVPPASACVGSQTIATSGKSTTDLSPSAPSKQSDNAPESELCRTLLSRTIKVLQLSDPARAFGVESATKDSVSQKTSCGSATNRYRTMRRRLLDLAPSPVERMARTRLIAPLHSVSPYADMIGDTRSMRHIVTSDSSSPRKPLSSRRRELVPDEPLCPLQWFRFEFSCLYFPSTMTRNGVAHYEHFLRSLLDCCMGMLLDCYPHEMTFYTQRPSTAAQSVLNHITRLRAEAETSMAIPYEHAPTEEGVRVRLKVLESVAPSHVQRMVRCGRGGDDPSTIVVTARDKADRRRKKSSVLAVAKGIPRTAKRLWTRVGALHKWCRHIGYLYSQFIEKHKAPQLHRDPATAMNTILESIVTGALMWGFRLNTPGVDKGKRFETVYQSIWHSFALLMPFVQDRPSAQRIPWFPRQPEGDDVSYPPLPRANCFEAPFRFRGTNVPMDRGPAASGDTSHTASDSSSDVEEGVAIVSLPVPIFVNDTTATGIETMESKSKDAEPQSAAKDEDRPDRSVVSCNDSPRRKFAALSNAELTEAGARIDATASNDEPDFPLWLCANNSVQWWRLSKPDDNDNDIADRSIGRGIDLEGQEGCSNVSSAHHRVGTFTRRARNVQQTKAMDDRRRRFEIMFPMYRGRDACVFAYALPSCDVAQHEPIAGSDTHLEGIVKHRNEVLAITEKDEDDRLEGQLAMPILRLVARMLGSMGIRPPGAVPGGMLQSPALQDFIVEWIEQFAEHNPLDASPLEQLETNPRVIGTPSPQDQTNTLRDTADFTAPRHQHEPQHGAGNSRSEVSVAPEWCDKSLCRTLDWFIVDDSVALDISAPVTQEDLDHACWRGGVAQSKVILGTCASIIEMCNRYQACEAATLVQIRNVLRGSSDDDCCPFRIIPQVKQRFC